MKYNFSLSIIITIIILIISSTSCFGQTINGLDLFDLYLKNNLEYKRLNKKYELNKLEIEIEYYSNIAENNKIDKLRYKVALLENEYQFEKMKYQKFKEIFNIYSSYILAQADLDILIGKKKYEAAILKELKKKYREGMVLKRDLDIQNNKLQSIKNNIDHLQKKIKFLKNRLDQSLILQDENYDYILNDKRQNFIGRIIDNRNLIDFSRQILINKNKILKLEVKRSQIYNTPVKVEIKIKQKRKLLNDALKINKKNKEQIEEEYKLIKEEFKNSLNLITIKINEAKQDYKILKKEFELGLNTEKHLIKNKNNISLLNLDRKRIILDYYKNQINYKIKML